MGILRIGAATMKPEFIYKNPSPVNRGYQDSFIRAMAIIENRSWESVFKDLCRLGLRMAESPQDGSVWKCYLQNYGTGPEIQLTYSHITVGEFSKNHPDSIWILKLGEGWVTCCIDGTIYDARNYKNKLVQKAYKVR